MSRAASLSADPVRLAPVTVWVVECGVYAERYIEGVYWSDELAMAANAHNDDEWVQAPSGTWDNGQDMGLAVSVFPYDLTMPPVDDPDLRAALNDVVANL